MRVFTRLSVAFKPRILPRADIRHLYQASADFIRFGPNGKIEKSKVPIRVGDPESTFVMIPTDVGHALQARDLLGQSSTAQTQDRSKLVSHHDTQHFANEALPDCPRLHIPVNLPRQTEGNTSPATLYLYGLLHTIALDDTAVWRPAADSIYKLLT